jgi:hypothetical protein
VSQFDAVATELQRRVGGYESDAERIRAQRHHEVLCLVLKELVGSDGTDAMLPSHAVDFVQTARIYADLAYPPPKDPK